MKAQTLGMNTRHMVSIVAIRQNDNTTTILIIIKLSMVLKAPARSAIPTKLVSIIFNNDHNGNNDSQFAFGVADDEKKKSNLVLWNRIGDDTHGNFIASQRMHSITNQLLNSTPDMVIFIIIIQN